MAIMHHPLTLPTSNLPRHTGVHLEQTNFRSMDESQIFLCTCCHGFDLSAWWLRCSKWPSYLLAPFLADNPYTQGSEAGAQKKAINQGYSFCIILKVGTWIYLEVKSLLFVISISFDSWILSCRLVATAYQPKLNFAKWGGGESWSTC